MSLEVKGYPMTSQGEDLEHEIKARRRPEALPCWEGLNVQASGPHCRDHVLRGKAQEHPGPTSADRCLWLPPGTGDR
jgi:hypothetical protein